MVFCADKQNLGYQSSYQNQGGDILFALYASELTLAEIADKLAISRTSLRNKIIDMGLKREPRIRRKSIIKEDILRLEEQGLNYKQIAARLDIHPTSLIAIRKRLGIYNPPKVVLEQQKKAYQARIENKKAGLKPAVKYKSNCLEIYLDEILEKLKQGISKAEVARIYNVSPATVFNLLALYEIKIPVMKKLDGKENALKRWFKNGLSVAGIASKLDCSTAVVEKKIKELKLKRDLATVKVNSKLAVAERVIKKMYKQGASFQEMGAVLNAHPISVAAKVKKMGLSRRVTKYKTKLDGVEKVLNKMRKAGSTYKEMAAALGVAPNTVANYFRRIKEGI